MSDKLLVKDTEAAAMLSMGRSTFWEAVRKKLLPEPVKIGGLTRWRVADLLAVVQASPTTRPSTAAAVEGTQRGYTQP
jgi:predicted DNA-binding transcriptional regulator AlpA